MTSSGASETDSARKRTSGSSAAHATRSRRRRRRRACGRRAARRRARGLDQRDRLLDGAGLADDLDAALELAAHAGAEERVVVDEHDAWRSRRRSSDELHLGARRRARCGPPRGRHGAPCARRSTRARRGDPPARRRGRSRRRDRGRRPRHAPRRLRVDVDAPRAGELRRVEDRLAGRGCQRSRVVVECPVAHADDLDLHAVAFLDLGGGAHQRAVQRVAAAAVSSALSHARSSRSWRRASCATSAGSSARRWIRASVCRTESCRCAATSARSWARIRAVRSAVSACAIRSHHGPKSMTLPARTTITGKATDCTCPSAGSARATSTAPTTMSAAPMRPRFVSPMPLRHTIIAAPTPTPTGSATCEPPPAAMATAAATIPAPRPSRQLAPASRRTAVGSPSSSASVAVMVR